ncbi:MAG: aldehyde dehydrogenase family protein, partial [Solirubrobacteraceae bacterium]|nr:aldehyde dehydrogenase family protein [Solirubrobacteraceae bacterium]
MPADPAALVASSAQVQPLWAALRVADRARYLRRAAQAVIDELDELAAVLGAEGGRTPGEVIALELLPAVDGLRWLADGGARALRERRLPVPRATSPVTRARRTYEPLGVVAVVGAGDAPFAQPLWQTGAALLAGNGVVLKPSPRAPVAGERIARLFARASLPEGLLAVLPGDDAAGRALVAAPGLAKVVFTGTRAAGQEVALACARAGVPVALQTAGVGAALVLADAGVDP